MRHLTKGRKLKRTSSHRDALMRNLATSLFQHKRIATTEAKAKELRPYAEQIITRAKRAVQSEKQGLLPNGQTIDIHARRIVYKEIRNKAVLQELFDTIAPLVAERPGGYTRIIKTGTRRGDGSRTAVIELVDWSAPQDGAVDFKSKKKRKSKKPEKVKVKKAATKDESPVEITEEMKEETLVEEQSAQSVEIVDENVETEVSQVSAEDVAEDSSVEEAQNEEEA